MPSTNPYKKVCAFCGKDFYTFNKNQKCCSYRCARHKESGKTPEEIKILDEQKSIPKYDMTTRKPIYTRTCHDCGAPTNNYRCPKCLYKFRLKHGVFITVTEE